MNFIIDAHLPSSLSAFFIEHAIIHVSTFKDGNSSSDKAINEFSVQNKCAVITKDSDFYYSFIAKQEPYKLILVKLGNMRLKELLDYFKRNSLKIVELIQENSFIILEPERIRILK